MGKIFYLMGKSSSGKDTLYKMLMQQSDFDLLPIIQYTTRPIRVGEIEGSEYYFVSKEQLDALSKAGKVIESRCYDTCHGAWIYATVYDDSIDLKHHNYVMIGTIESFVKVKEYFGGDIVIPIMLYCDDGVRLQRALDRERSEDAPKYREICRRFLSDDEDFSQEKQSKAGITRVFNSENTADCLLEVIPFMKEMV